MKKRLLGLVAIPLIAIGSLTYAENDLIVHDTTGGTITVYGTGADGKIYGITIQDKNLGATEIYTGVDNKNTYGYYFQRGNNYGNSGDSSTVSTLLSTDDLSNWANKGYSGNVTQFIQAANSYGDYRSGLTNYNETGAIQHSLWGGSGDNDNIEGIVKGYNTVNHVVTNPENRQGPCPEGYHVPSAGEWQELLKLYAEAKGYTLNTQGGDYAWANTIAEGRNFSNDLKLPLAGYRAYYVGAVYGQGGLAYYWSSSPRGGSNPRYAWYLYFISDIVVPSDYGDRANGQSLRCFRDSYVKLPKTLNLFFMLSTGDVQEVGTGEVTENMTGAVPEKAKNMTKTGYVLEYRYLSGADATTGFDFETTPISGAWADENDNVYFIAQWTGIKYEIKFEAGDGTGTMENQTFTYDITGTLNRNAFTKNGYTFSGWTNGTTGYTDGQEVVNLTTTGEDVITLTAEWIPTEYTITYELDGGTNSENNTGIYTIETPDITLENPTKDGYTFDGWFIDSQFTTGITTIPTGTTGDITLYAKWTENKKSSGSSGGGGRSSKTSSDEKDTINNPSVTDVTAPLESGAQGDSDDGSPLSRGDTASAERGSTQNYSQEFQEAYEFAKEKGITTMPTINEANMNGKLTRIAMAKMLSYYAINVLGQKPDETRNNKFNDITDKLDAQYDSGVTLAYQLGIMGINMPDNMFRPDDEVTRAEFATALSRMLYSTPDGKPYYVTHLEKLKAEKVLTNDDYKMKELRGYVMIMLKRSAK